MAIGDIGLVGSNNSKVSGTTLAITNTSGATIPAGTLLVLGFVIDNPASVTQPTITFTGNHASLGTWTNARSPVSSGVTTTAGSGIWGYAYYVYTSGTILSGAAITTINTSVAVVARAAVVEGF